MPSQELQFEEIEPEVIGTVENGRVQLDPALETPVELETAPEQEKIDEVSKTTTPEETEALRAELGKKIDGVLSLVNALKPAEERIISTLKNKISEREETDKVEKENRKISDKELKTQNKTELKELNDEIKSLKKLVSQKEKEIKKLFKQVKEALYNGE